MLNDFDLEQKIQKDSAKKDKRKNRKMKVSGKSVIQLKEIIGQKSSNQEIKKSRRS